MPAMPGWGARGASPSARSTPSTDRTSSSAVLLACLIEASASTAFSGWDSARCSPTPACTLIWLSECASTSWSSRAMRIRSSSAAVWRRRAAADRKAATRARRDARSSPKPIANTRPSVVPSSRGGGHNVASPITHTANTATHALASDTHAHTRAPRTTAPARAEAKASGGGPPDAANSREATDTAATTATTGPGRRRAAMSASGPASDSASVRAATAGGCSPPRSTTNAPISWTNALSSTGTQSRSAREGPRRMASGSWSAQLPPPQGGPSWCE